MAEVHEDKSLAARWKVCAVSRSHPRELWFLGCAWFFVPLTRKMHYHPCKDLPLSSFLCSERKRGRRLPREEDQPEGFTRDN